MANGRLHPQQKPGMHEAATHAGERWRGQMASPISAPLAQEQKGAHHPARNPQKGR